MNRSDPLATGGTDVLAAEAAAAPLTSAPEASDDRSPRTIDLPSSSLLSSST